jgi:hypothetical protein
MIMEFERGNTGWPFIEKWLWKRIGTCRKTDYVMKPRRTHPGLQNVLTNGLPCHTLASVCLLGKI